MPTERMNVSYSDKALRRIIFAESDKIFLDFIQHFVLFKLLDDSVTSRVDRM